MISSRPDRCQLGAVADEPMVSPLVDEIIEPKVEAGEQVIASVVDMDEDIAMLFGNDDFEDDDSDGAPTERLRAIEDLSNRLGNLEYEHIQLVKKVIQVMASQMVYVADIWEQVGAQVEQGSSAVERFTDSAAADYGFRDE
ncbi:hypothetical protein Tco_0813275 [Tanacetum coccineum]